MTTKKRYHEIDVCRGIGIILVVLGHALKQTGVLTPVMDGLLSVIYSFHMPLFFILAGFTALKILGFSGNDEKAGYIRGRAKRLLIPYFVIGVLYIPLKLYMSKYAVKPYDVSQIWRILIGENPNTALWFLYILFLCTLVSVFILQMKNLHIVLTAAFVLSAVCCLMNWSVRFPKYYFFFVLGIVFRSQYAQIKSKICQLPMLLISLAAFVVGNIFYYRYGGIWFMITALSGSMLCFMIACALSGEIVPAGRDVKEWPRPLRWLHMAGEYSMDIYILSEPVMTVLRLILWNILGVGAGACTWLCFLGALVIPLPVSILIIRKVKLFRLLVLGMD